MSRTHVVLRVAILTLFAAAPAGCGQDDGVDESLQPPQPTLDASVLGGTGGTAGGGSGSVIPGAVVRINEVIRRDGAPDLVELLNRSPAAVDLGGWQVTDDPSGAPGKAALPAGTRIEGGALLVLTIDDATVGFGLGGAEAFALSRPDGTPVDSTAWTDGQAPVGASWGRLPDGEGPFQTLFRPTPGASNDAGSTPDAGSSPGADAGATAGDAGAPPDANVTDAATTPPAGDAVAPVTPAGPLVVNEVVADGPDGDWVELFNRGDAPAPLDGLHLTDDPDAEPFAYPLPEGTTLDPGAYLVVPVSGAATGFGLGSDEAVALVDASGAVVDVADWDEGAAPAGSSFGRLPDGSGPFVTLGRPTPGTPNTDAVDPPPPPAEMCGDGRCAGPETATDCPLDCAPETGLVVNEVVAAGQPVDLVELYNGNNEPVTVGGYFVSDDPDAEPERGALPEGLAVPARGYLVLEIDTDTVGFRLGAAESFGLTDPAGRLVDRTTWADGDAPEGGSWARRPDGVGAFHRTEVATPGAPNVD